MNTLDILIQSGLTTKQATVYLAALELGQFSITSLAHKSGIKRPTCYLIVDDLISKGCITKVPRAKKGLYVAESPDVLVEKAEQQIQKLKTITPQLKRLHQKSKTEPLVKFFLGPKSMENIYRDILVTKPDMIYGMLSPDDLYGVTGKDFLDNWTKTRVKEGIPSQVIQTKDNRKEYFYGSSKELMREVRYFTGNLNVPGAVGIYADKVGFISGKADNFSFIVTSIDFRNMMKGIFDALWSVSVPKGEQK